MCGAFGEFDEDAARRLRMKESDHATVRAGSGCRTDEGESCCSERLNRHVDPVDAEADVVDPFAA